MREPIKLIAQVEQALMRCALLASEQVGTALEFGDVVHPGDDRPETICGGTDSVNMRRGGRRGVDNGLAALPVGRRYGN
jgi:hypothetical protein